MSIRSFMQIVNEAISKRATVPPEWVGSRERSPVGDVLFHGTPMDHLVNILRTNAIDTGIDWRGEGERVALTRSYHVARSFGEQGDYAIWPSVLVLNWKKLAAAYPIIPHNDTDSEGEHWKNANSEDGTEQEEALYGAIQPLSRFLISVNVRPAHVREAMQDDGFIEWLIEEKGWVKTKRAAVAMTAAVLRHPLMNRWVPPL